MRLASILNPFRWRSSAATPDVSPEPSGGRGTIRARYDAAQTNDDNKRHWAAVDHLSADAANNVAVRRTIRTRARHEVANNSYLKGIVSTVANDTVGTGPTLQMLTEDHPLNSQVESDFAAWAREVRLAEKLRIMRAARCESGEVFAVFVTNPSLLSPIKLDVKLVEADQVADVTWESWADPNKSDGIVFDDAGNPMTYRILRHHPGSLNWGFSSLEFADVPARLVFHYFKNERPGQRRGIPDVTPALSIFPDLRRYCAAVIAAAETAADYAMTIESAAGDTDDTDDPEPMDKVELEKRMATILPKGWKMSQTRAEQPTMTYPAFVDKKLAEAARCMNVPYTRAALDSSVATTSARYMDEQIYLRSIEIDRGDLEQFLDRLLDEWLTEANRVARDDGAPMLAQSVTAFPHQWFWPITVEHADPDKVESANGAALKNGTTTLPRILARKGLDWENEQVAAARSLGITVQQYQEILRLNMLPPNHGNGGQSPGTQPPAKSPAPAQQ